MLYSEISNSELLDSFAVFAAVADENSTIAVCGEFENTLSILPILQKWRFNLGTIAVGYSE